LFFILARCCCFWPCIVVPLQLLYIYIYMRGEILWVFFTQYIHIRDKPKKKKRWRGISLLINFRVEFTLFINYLFFSHIFFTYPPFHFNFVNYLFFSHILILVNKISLFIISFLSFFFFCNNAMCKIYHQSNAFIFFNRNVIILF
jgi:hypothetical protein